MNTTGIGSYIRERRERLGWTQARLADEIGMDRSRVAQIEGGRVALPGADVRRRIAKALGVSHLELLIAAGELTAGELADAGKTGVVERGPGDPRTRLIAVAERLAPAKVPMGLEILEALDRSRAGWP